MAALRRRRVIRHSHNAVINRNRNWKMSHAECARVGRAKEVTQLLLVADLQSSRGSVVRNGMERVITPAVRGCVRRIKTAGKINKLLNAQGWSDEGRVGEKANTCSLNVALSRRRSDSGLQSQTGGSQ